MVQRIKHIKEKKKAMANLLVEKERLNEYTIRPVIFGVRDFDDVSLFDQCMRKSMKDFGFNKDELKASICFIVGAEQNGISKLASRWCVQHGYQHALFSPNWGDVDIEGAVVKYRNNEPYNAVAGHWRDEEMAEVCTHGITFYDGVSSGTQDMMDRVIERGSPCAVYYVDTDSEDDHAQKSQGGGSRHP